MTVKDNRFKPDVAKQPVNDGSTFFSWADSVEREHNVRHDSKLFYSGDPTDDPSTAYSFTISAGTWHYFCEVHGSRRGGMDGVVRVKPSSSQALSGEIRIDWGNGTSTGDRWDVRFRVGKRDFRTWHSNTTLSYDIFGTNDVPVDVKPGKTYTFQARSELSSDPTRRSGWSPKLVVVAQ